MNNERDVEFTPDPSTAGQGVEFTPSPTLEGGSTATGGTTGTGAFGTGTTGGYNAGSFGAGAGAAGSTGTMGNTGTGSTGGFGASDSGESGGGLRAAAGEQLQQAKELVGQAQERATEQVRSRIDAQKTRAAGSLSSVAQTLRSSGEQMQGQEGISRYLTRAADEVENLAHYLEDREVGELLGQVEDFARRQPVAFLGGAFTLGVLGARFLKSSRSNLRGPNGGYSGGYDASGAGFDNQALTSRVRDPERDAVGRPDAPGYAPPSERSGSEYKSSGPRQDF